MGILSLSHTHTQQNDYTHTLPEVQGIRKYPHLIPSSDAWLSFQYQRAWLMAPRRSACPEAGNALTLQRYGQCRFPTGVRRNDPVLTYCSVFPEVQKGSEFILQMEELPPAFRKTSQKGVSYPDRIVKGPLANCSGSIPGSIPGSK